jgi:hypothetical protein
MKHRPENDPRLPRNLADTVAIYAIIAVVALVALVPLAADEAASMKLAGRPPAAGQSSDAGR